MAFTNGDTYYFTKKDLGDVFINWRRRTETGEVTPQEEIDNLSDEIYRERYVDEFTDNLRFVMRKAVRKRVEIHTAVVHPHPESTELVIVELPHIGAQSVVPKADGYVSGQLVAFVPEGSTVPEWMIQYLGLEGYLSGSRGNKVRPRKFRGVPSDGLIYAPELGWELPIGTDVGELLGFTV